MMQKVIAIEVTYAETPVYAAAVLGPMVASFSKQNATL